MDAGKGLRIEPGDLVIRKLSSGSEETYRISDPGYYEGAEGIEANYQMHVHKLSPEDAASAVACAGRKKLATTGATGFLLNGTTMGRTLSRVI